MLLLALNAIFAGLFFSFTRTAYRRGMPFLSAGWSAISVEVHKPDYRSNVESRHIISDGGRFLIGGLVWMGIALFTAGCGVYFAVQAVQLVAG